MGSWNRIKVKSRVGILIKVMRIRNTNNIGSFSPAVTLYWLMYSIAEWTPPMLWSRRHCTPPPALQTSTRRSANVTWCSKAHCGAPARSGFESPTLGIQKFGNVVKIYGNQLHWCRLREKLVICSSGGYAPTNFRFEAMHKSLVMKTNESVEKLIWKLRKRLSSHGFHFEGHPLVRQIRLLCVF